MNKKFTSQNRKKESPINSMGFRDDGVGRVSLSSYSHLNPVISVKKARKLLGKDSGKFTDDDIRQLLFQLGILADTTIETYLVLKSNNSGIIRS